jgi:hypothetical protein
MGRLMCCSKNGGTVADWIMQNGQYQSGNVITGLTVNPEGIPTRGLYAARSLGPTHPKLRSWNPPAIRAGRGQVGPCLTDEAYRPLPERRPYVSRYAGARTLQQRSLRQILQVESSYLLCSRPTLLLTHV